MIVNFLREDSIYRNTKDERYYVLEEGSAYLLTGLPSPYLLREVLAYITSL